MIHKIERLASVGKFRDYQAAGTANFNKLTVIYADNGTGKTTLTAVLRSLTQGEPEIVRRRISTNPTILQAAQVIQRNAANVYTHHTLRAAGWSNPFPNIEIFDIHFVNDNIYSGFDFNEGQKRMLHHFVIGAHGVAVKLQIEQNKLAKTASRQTQENVTNQIVGAVGFGLTPDNVAAFVDIPTESAHDIDNRIADALVRLTSARANVVIQQLALLIEVHSIPNQIGFDALIVDLGSTIQAIQDEALKTLFTNHCRELSSNSIDNAETWVKAGFEYFQDKKATVEGHPQEINCPFCTQPVSNAIDIISAYTLRFNEEFNNLIARLNVHLAAVRAFNLDFHIQAVNSFSQPNADRIASWSVHLPATVIPPVFDLIADEAALRALLASAISIIEQKIQNPSNAIAVDDVTAFRTVIETINVNIVAYNRNVQAYNTAISVFRNSIQTEMVALSTFNNLQRIKKRFEDGIAGLCTQLTTEKVNLRTLETAYTQLSQSEEAAATIFFAQYRDRINYYLSTIFKTPFLIENVVHVRPQGRAMESKINYRLTINGQGISFDLNQPLSAKDCMSEGDKSTLALAFFMAKLDIDPSVADKIVIFDDPLSSFDNNRKLYTVLLLRSLLARVRQIVVLSHNEYFLHEIYKHTDRAHRKSLRITENFVNHSSRIETVDLEQMVDIHYFRNIRELETFLANADVANREHILGLIRNVLEAHIKFKFYRQTAGLPENQRTFGNLIDRLAVQNVVFRDIPNSAAIYTKLRLLNGVSCRPHHGEAIPDYGELGIDPNTIPVPLLAQLVTDTLHLIDNQL